MTEQILGSWHYESDGDNGDKTHYAVRDSADSPCGVERIDFKTAELARKFIKESNALIFRVLNQWRLKSSPASTPSSHRAAQPIGRTNVSDAPNCTHKQFTEHQSYCPDCGLSRSEVLIAACEPYLKEEETPSECIARNRRDANGCLTMLIEERRKIESLQARLAEAEALLDAAAHVIIDHECVEISAEWIDGWAEKYEAFLGRERP